MCRCGSYKPDDDLEKLTGITSYKESTLRKLLELEGVSNRFKTNDSRLKRMIDDPPSAAEYGGSADEFQQLRVRLFLMLLFSHPSLPEY